MAGSPPRKCRVGECGGGVCLSRLSDKARIHWGGVDGNEYECVGGRWDGGGGWIEGGVRREVEVEGEMEMEMERRERSLALFLPYNTYVRTYITYQYKAHPQGERRETRDKRQERERERERETVQMTAVVPGEYM